MTWYSVGAQTRPVVRVYRHIFPSTSHDPLFVVSVPQQPCTMPGAVGFSNRAVSTAHGAACAVGAILARLSLASAAATASAGAAASDDNMVSGDGSSASRAWATLSDDALPSALSSVVAAIGHPVSLVHGAACGAIGRVGAVGPLPLPSARHEATTAATVASGPKSHPQGGDDRVSTVQKVFEQLWKACKLGETTDASRRAEAAAEALGRCCRGARRGIVEGEGQGAEGKWVSARVRKTLEVLFDMAKNQVRWNERSAPSIRPCSTIMCV